ncbi:MAG: sigma-70 family RNA polymerase sigma factor [Gemmatimonadaceae bacterium]
MEPWLALLNSGNTDAAWEIFAARYRALMLATIRQFVEDTDDVSDVFASTCEALSVNDFARLKRYSEHAEKRASASTWLVVVVRNISIDWLRQRDGRRRVTVPPTMTALQQQIYFAICVQRQSQIEAYETIRSQTQSSLSFREFLREVRAINRVAPCISVVRSNTIRNPADTQSAIAESDPAEVAESARRLASALATQSPDVRVAVELFVVERMPAADVARVVGWPNTKTVYNRVYRALASLRAELLRTGIGPHDL